MKQITAELNWVEVKAELPPAGKRVIVFWATPKYKRRIPPDFATYYPKGDRFHGSAEGFWFDNGAGPARPSPDYWCYIKTPDGRIWKK